MTTEQDVQRVQEQSSSGPESPEPPPPETAEPPAVVTAAPPQLEMGLGHAAVKLGDLEKGLFQLLQDVRPLAEAELSQRATDDLTSAFASLGVVAHQMETAFLGLRMVRMAFSLAAEREVQALVRGDLGAVPGQRMVSLYVQGIEQVGGRR